MGDAERTLVMLVLANEKCPVEEWLDRIRDKTTRARIERQTDKPSRGLGAQKGLQGVAELKIDFGPGYRVYYGLLDQKTIVVLIVGGDKSNQNRDIADARQLCADFQAGGSAEAALKAWNEEEKDKMKLKSFDERLAQDLRDPEFATAYLQDAWDDSPEEFLVALRKHVQANGGMSACAENAQVTREALYRMLSEKGNPELRSLRAVLQACRLNVSFERQEELLAA